MYDSIACMLKRHSINIYNIFNLINVYIYIYIYIYILICYG